MVPVDLRLTPILFVSESMTVRVLLQDPETRLVYPTLPLPPSEPALSKNRKYWPVPSTPMMPQSLSDTIRLGVSTCVLLSVESIVKTEYELEPEISWAATTTDFTGSHARDGASSAPLAALVS